MVLGLYLICAIFLLIYYLKCCYRKKKKIPSTLMFCTMPWCLKVVWHMHKKKKKDLEMKTTIGNWS